MGIHDNNNLNRANSSQSQFFHSLNSEIGSMNKPKCFSRRHSFVKVLINYTTKLRLPPLFVRNFGKFLPANVKLRAISGETWDVKVKDEIGGDDDDDAETYRCFAGRGWTKFVKDLDLKFGEFLVFFLNVGEESTFDVSVYGTHCCERPISTMDHVDCERPIFQLKNDCPNDPEIEGAAVTERPRFELFLSDARKWRWNVPKKFLEAAKLTEKRAVVLEYPPKKRYWAVLLAVQTDSRTKMTKGWNEFRQENGLVMGKTYSFEFNPTTNVIEVKEHK